MSKHCSFTWHEHSLDAHTLPFYSENPIKIIITRTETANALDGLVKLSSLRVPPVKCLLLWPLVVIMTSSDSQLFCRFLKNIFNSLLREIVSFIVWETEPDGKGGKKSKNKDITPPQAHKNYTMGSHPTYDQISFYISFKQIWIQFQLYSLTWVFSPHFSERFAL